VKLIVGLCLLLAACGGGSSEPDGAAALRLIFDGRYGEFYDQLDPQVRAKTAKSDYVACQTKASDGSGTIQLQQIERGDGSFTKKSDGSRVLAKYTTVRIGAKGDRASESAVVTVWWTETTEGWRIIGIDVPDGADDSDCLAAA
jgi:hypothetical protein